MAKFVLKNCSVVVNGVDLSDHATSAEIDLKKKSIDTTCFSGLGTEAVAGLSDDGISIDFQQDFGAAEVDATLGPLYFNETTFVVTVMPAQGAVSATNPAYSANCILLEYTPLKGKVGDLSTTTIKFVVQGLITATY